MRPSILLLLRFCFCMRVRATTKKKSKQKRMSKKRGLSLEEKREAVKAFYIEEVRARAVSRHFSRFFFFFRIRRFSTFFG